MTVAELRLCIRWRRRDDRYTRQPYFSVMTPRQVSAVREWRSGEAAEIRSDALFMRATAWHPRDLIRAVRARGG